MNFKPQVRLFPMPAKVADVKHKLDGKIILSQVQPPKPLNLPQKMGVRHLPALSAAPSCPEVT